ncbi:Lrp/AsnC family transcriptional regulator [Canibacter zhoujuaniae]|uniref:Lrp/AsnC family transcriptional regulator n=1 Tax=Canibacter zhoujuaniae TaxID=2708343 RepID=UPI00142221EB|nr:Lrp/AsnC family transcriptional regulator [Canibacter zhoujuaniae]
MKLDSTHLQMLDLLRRDSRLSIAALAEKLSISRSNAYQRFEALKEAGVIIGATIDIDFNAVGVGVCALVFVSLQQNQWQRFREKLVDLAELEYFAVITGSYDCMLLVRTTSVSGVHNLVTNKLSQWPEIKTTETVFIMDEGWSLVDIARTLENSPSAQEYPAADGMLRYIKRK